ncbi:hypothetical protein CG007_00940 [Mesoplasma entomophilum]|uniref:ABC transporter ATP-binding protein/permease n=1 Tax=Mesoplasma coleopterae TaxID=324078 RepID=A0A2K8P2H9_9MOLU|nr:MULTISPECIES: ABC transporter ATP-binding protein [Mesoplasma]ATZ20698.1 ABC transporter ATP-binding protein/permease [Mesoplasma coleopterae]AVN60188.1 hypothetical protein CG007_00940 [Mesoplasma entomophilum]AVN62879.1 hypothetical protein CG000_00975 [Mesoplasma coleopterae]
MKNVYAKNKMGILWFSILAFIAAAALVFSGYVISYLINTAVDVVNGASEKMNLLFIEIGVCALSFGICLLFSYLQTQQKNKIIKEFNLYLRNKVSNKIINLDLKDLDSKNKGDLISWLTNDINQIESKNFENMFLFIETFLTAFLAIIAIFLLNWITGLVTILCFIILLIVPSLLQKSMVKIVNKVSLKQEEFSSKVEDVISGYREFLYNDKTEIFSEIISQKSFELETYKQKNKNIENLQITGINSIGAICQIGLVIMTVILASYKIAPIGLVFAVPQLAGNFLGNAQRSLGAFFGLLGSKELFKKFIFKNTELKINEIEPFNSIKIKNLNLSINENNLYNSLNFEIKKGKKYLISGRSGVGKSTLMKILFGLISEYDGEILWNNDLNLLKISSKQIWNQIYYVQQETIIFDASFKENITLFDSSISDKEIFNIVKLVNLQELVSKNNNILSFKCKDISKGEAQRIAIGRALLSNKKVIYLDEPTASLDKSNTELIENLILKNSDLTVLFISHTSDIQNQMFDKVIKL